MARRERGSMGAKAHKKADKEKNNVSGYLVLPDDMKSFKLKKGSNEIDILPYEVSVDTHPEQDKGELFYQRTIFVHYNVGPEEQSLLCPKTLGKNMPCPICKDVAKMYKDPDVDDDTISDIKAKKRELFNVNDATEEGEDPQLLEISYYNFGKLLDEEIREGGPDIGDFAELEGGKTIKVRMGSDTAGSYAFIKATRIDFEDRDDYDEDILDKVADLDAMLVVKSFEEIEAIYNGEAPESTNSSEEQKEEKKEEKSTRRSRKPKEEKEEKKKEKSTRSSRSSKKTEEKSEQKEEKEEKPAKPDRTERKKRAEEAKKKAEGKEDNPCPCGYKFGKDCDEYPDDCDACDKWEDCMDEKEKSD